jgi:ABC-type glycerol-3-phosphate transport system substrate-binding protein
VGITKQWSKTAAITAVGVGIALLTACSSGGSGNGSDAPVRLWLNGTGDDQNQQEWESALADFTKETGVKVELTRYQNDQFKQNLANATGTETMPDVFLNWTGIGLIGNVYDSGTLLALDDWAKDDGWGERFPESSLAAASIDGKLMALPWSIQKMAVAYKKSTFEAAGVTPPTTMDELDSVMETLKAQGISPWSFAGKNSWDTMRLADSLLEWSCGAKEFDALRNLDSDWTTSTCATAAFQTFRDWIDNEYLAPDYMGLDPNAADMWKPIIAGTAAMTIEGSWSGGTLRDNGADASEYAFFTFPTGTDRISGFQQAFYVNKDAKNLDGAAKLLDYLATPKVYETYRSLLGGSLPAVNGVSKPDLSDTYTDYDAAFWSYGNDAAGVYGPSDQAFPPDVAQAFLLNNDKLQLGQQTPEQAVAGIQQAADAWSAQNGG